MSATISTNPFDCYEFHEDDVIVCPKCGARTYEKDELFWDIQVCLSCLYTFQVEIIL